jgi:predicted dehydrogenase
MIGVGIVGLSAAGGWAANAHVPALAALDGFEVRALSASSADSARAAGERYGVPLAFGTAEELAARDEVDLVAVTVRVARHREPVLAAIRAGKAVYCEWPLARDLAEAEELAAAARASGVRTTIGLQGRSAPVLLHIRDLVAGGYVGEVLSTTIVASAGAWGATFQAREPYLLDRDSGNTLLNVAAGHVTDALAMCLGEFRELNAVVANRRKQSRNADTGELAPMTTDDQIAVAGVLESGAVASLHFRGGDSPATGLYWEINGTDGDLVITGDWGYVHLGPVAVRGRRGDAPLADLPVPDRYVLVPSLAGHEGEPPYNVAHAYARLDAAPTFEDAVRRHRLLDRIVRAARSQSAAGP